MTCHEKLVSAADPHVHTVVGVNTLIVMSVRFSGSRGEQTHDSNFLMALVTDALEIFSLKYVLGDKAYLSEEILGWLWERSIKAVIPLKKRSDPSAWRDHQAASAQLAKWYDDDQRDFHEVYRLRPKVESLFSAMKRITGDYCWSHGRPRAEIKNADEPCIAWVNETLCKLIYMNLRTTVFYEALTSCMIDYRHPERCFPPLPNAVLAA
jgi:hypothetical protein